MQIQSNLGSTIAMAFDECAPALADRSYVEASVARTTRWLERCKTKMQQLNAEEGTVNRHQMLFESTRGLSILISVLIMQNVFQNWI